MPQPVIISTQTIFEPITNKFLQLIQKTKNMNHFFSQVQKTKTKRNPHQINQTHFRKQA